MEIIKAKSYIKLGLSLRYLIDRKQGDPLGGKYILQNIATVFDLLKVLELNATTKSSGYNQLKILEGQLKQANLVTTTITQTQADELEKVCRKIRDALLTESEVVELVLKSQVPDRKGFFIPDEITMEWLLKVPLPFLAAVFGVLASVYVLGVESSQIPVVRDIFKLESQQKLPADQKTVQQKD